MGTFMPDYGQSGQMDSSGHGIGTVFTYTTSHDANNLFNDNQEVLNESDMREIDHFFDNPQPAGMPQRNDSNVSGEQSNFVPNYTYNQAANGGTINPASTLASTSQASYQTLSPSHHMSAGSYMGNFAMPNNQRNTTEDDVADVAGALLGMSEGQHHPHAFSNSTMGGMSAMGSPWGGVGYPMAPSNGLPVSSRHSSSDSNMNTIQQQAQAAQAMMFRQQQNLVYNSHRGTRQMQPHVRTGSNSSDNGAYGYPGQHMQGMTPSMSKQSAAMMPPISFGSDGSITGTPYGYHGPDNQNIRYNKAGNLMGVPGVEQASVPDSENSHVRQVTQQRQHQNHTRQSRNGSHNLNSTLSSPSDGLPPTPTMAAPAPQQAGTWGNLEVVDPYSEAHHNGTAARPHKRKRSQVELDDDAEYQPNSRLHPNVKQEAPSDDEYSEFTTPSNYATASKRRRSTAYERMNSGSSPSSLVDGAGSPTNGSSSNSRRKGSSKSRQNLSDEQKRRNHIVSEQKRRNVIKQGYQDLDDLVPALNHGKSGLSKAEQVKEVVAYLESIIESNRLVEEQLEKMQVNDGHDEDAAGDDDPAPQ